MVVSRSASSACAMRRRVLPSHEDVRGERPAEDAAPSPRRPRRRSRARSGSARAGRPSMFTYCEPWPGKRKATLPAPGRGRGRCPWPASSAPRRGARPCRAPSSAFSPFSARSAALVEGDDQALGRGEDLGAGRRAARSLPALASASARCELGAQRRRRRRRPARAGRPAGRARRGDARAEPLSTALDAPGTCTIGRARGEHAGDVLLEHDVEVGAAEAEGRDAGAARRRRRGAPRAAPGVLT